MFVLGGVHGFLLHLIDCLDDLTNVSTVLIDVLLNGQETHGVGHLVNLWQLSDLLLKWGLFEEISQFWLMIKLSHLLLSEVILMVHPDSMLLNIIHSSVSEVYHCENIATNSSFL